MTSLPRSWARTSPVPVHMTRSPTSKTNTRSPKRRSRKSPNPKTISVRYSLHMLELKAPGPGVEVRVAPWGAIKILDGPASDPHNLTPPDVIELDPSVWLRVASGVTTWDEERAAGFATGVCYDLSLRTYAYRE